MGGFKLALKFSKKFYPDFIVGPVPLGKGEMGYYDMAFGKGDKRTAWPLCWPRVPALSHTTVLVRRKPLSKRHSKNWMPCTEGRPPDRLRESTDSKTGETTNLRRGHGWRAFESPKRCCDRSPDPSKTKSTLPARSWTHTNRWEFRAPFFRATRPSATCWHRNPTQKDQ